MYTQTQVTEQKQRFDNFLKVANLEKIGERYIYFTLNNQDKGLFNQYNYIRRVLRLCANVSHCMYHPDYLDKGLFYADILQTEAINAYFKAIK